MIVKPWYIEKKNFFWSYFLRNCDIFQFFGQLQSVWSQSFTDRGKACQSRADSQESANKFISVDTKGHSRQKRRGNSRAATLENAPREIFNKRSLLENEQEVEIPLWSPRNSVEPAACSRNEWKNVWELCERFLDDDFSRGNGISSLRIVLYSRCLRRIRGV